MSLAVAPAARAEPIQITALTPTKVVREASASQSELARLAAQLGDRDEGTRMRAFDALTRLDRDALPAIRTRLKQLGSKRPPLDRVLTVMTDFREVQGVNRPDAPVDLAAGVLKVLAEGGPSAEKVAIAEPLLLLRSLEAMHTPEAAQVALDVFGLDDKAWHYESRRSLARFGPVMLPALVAWETRHDKRWVRRFCRWGIDELGLDSPGQAVAAMDVASLAALLRAYGEVLNFEAMPVIVSHVGDPRIPVRQAARWATEKFGRNAIWQIREAYLNATGKDADPEWSHGRALAELYEVHDAPKRERVRQALAQSQQALESGDESGARTVLDDALHRAPTEDAISEAAPAYAALGERALARDDLAQAARDYGRALRLAPAHAEAAKWRARASFVAAERRLASGVVDLPAYEHALALAPDDARAQSIVDVLTGKVAEREAHRRSLVAWAAVLLLGIAGLGLLRREELAVDGEPPLDDEVADEDDDEAS